MRPKFSIAVFIIFSPSSTESTIDKKKYVRQRLQITNNIIKPMHDKKKLKINISIADCQF